MEKSGCILNLKTIPYWKCCKDAGEQEQEFKGILTIWKDYCNYIVFMEFSVHFSFC